MKIHLLKQVDVERKRVLLRGDLDVPLSREREGVRIVDDLRLLRMTPTFDFLLSKRSKIVVIGHVNRPGGRVIEEDRVSPIVAWFSSRYPGKVKYVREIVGTGVRQSVLALGEGEMLFLENLRFDSGEEANRESFARELSTYGEIFVNECFAASHRNDASFSAITKFLPASGGLNLENEVENLSQILTHSRKPLLVIIGGSKIETKIPVIDRFLTVADKVLVTGKVGVEIDKLVHYHSQKLIYSTGDPDILPGELERFASMVAIAGTIVWNGPAGDTSRGYVEGTRRLAELIVASSAKTVVGGGDTNEVLRKFGLREKFSFVSTGGGAMLEFLAGKELPGIQPLIIA